MLQEVNSATAGEIQDDHCLCCESSAELGTGALNTRHLTVGAHFPSFRKCLFSELCEASDLHIKRELSVLLQ